MISSCDPAADRDSDRVSRLTQFSFRIPESLLDAVRQHTSNISAYLRALIEDDLGRKSDTREYPKTPYVYHGSLVRVVDGDTLEIDLDVGFSITIRSTVRLELVNAPELDTAAGKRARDFIARKLKSANLVVETKKRGKFGRFVAKVFFHRTRSDYREILQHGSLINDELVTAGHAIRSN